MITITIPSGVLVLLGFLTAYIVRKVYYLYKRKELYKRGYCEMREYAEGLLDQRGNLIKCYDEQSKDIKKLQKITEEALNLADRVTGNTHPHGAYKDTDHDNNGHR
jgi:hypothetical protein